MATVTDVEVANASFPTVRQDLNDILEAIATNFSADAEPTTTYPNQWWYETDTNKLYIRNEDNDAWIHVLTLDQTTDTVSSVQGVSTDKIEEGNSSVEVIDTGTGYLQFNVDGAEIARIDSSGMKFGDNEQAIFGAGSDLKIYHDGSNSIIADTGTGGLEIKGATTVVIRENGTDDKMFRGTGGGAAELFYDNATKLATSATGVTVTGTCTATAFSGDGSGLTGVGGGITSADLWRLTTTVTVDGTVLSNFEQPDAESPGTIGSSMSVSSGVFTFPSTGIWLIMVQAFIISDADAAAQCNLQVSTDGGSNFSVAAVCDGGNSNASEKRATCFSQFILDVTSTSSIKVRLQGQSLVGSEIIGDTNDNLTSISFIRLGDT